MVVLDWLRRPTHIGVCVRPPGGCRCAHPTTFSPALCGRGCACYCRQLVCPECHAVEPLSRPCINSLKAKQALRCKACGQDDLRFKVGAAGRPAGVCARAGADGCCARCVRGLLLLSGKGARKEAGASCA